MRVLIAGGNQMKNFAPRYYDYANKLANGFTRDNHTVLRYLDRDASRLSNVFRMRKLGIGAANNKFLRHVDIFQPDLIIFFHADVIRTDTLRKLRDSHPDIKLAQVGVDPLFMPGNVQLLNSRSSLMDATFVTTAGEGLKKKFRRTAGLLHSQHHRYRHGNRPRLRCGLQHRLDIRLWVIRRGRRRPAQGGDGPDRPTPARNSFLPARG
jgi:hypothetical protein